MILKLFNEETAIVTLKIARLGLFSASPRQLDNKFKLSAALVLLLLDIVNIFSVAYMVVHIIFCFCFKRKLVCWMVFPRGFLRRNCNHNVAVIRGI
jgi:hypothetical protein